MSESTRFFLLGIVLALVAFAILMPYYRGHGNGSFYPVYGPYYAHGGRPYRPGLLY